MPKTKKNRMPLGSPVIEPQTPHAPPEIPFEEPLPRPATPPLNVGEILANVRPDIMEELNAMNLAINTNNGDVLNWATNERMKLDVLIKKIEEERAEDERKSQKQLSQKRGYLRDWWRWLRGVKD
jgi:hypothetical protein